MTLSDMLRVDAEFWIGADQVLGSSEIEQVDITHSYWVENFDDVWLDCLDDVIVWLNLLIAEAIEGEDNA